MRVNLTYNGVTFWWCNSTFTSLLFRKQDLIRSNLNYKVDDETNHWIAEVVTDWLFSGILNYNSDDDDDDDD